MNINSHLFYCPVLCINTPIKIPLNEILINHEKDIYQLQCPYCNIQVIPCENCFQLVKYPNNSSQDENIPFISCKRCGFINVFNESIRLLIGKSYNIYPIPYPIVRALQYSIDNNYIHYLEDHLLQLTKGNTKSQHKSNDNKKNDNEDDSLLFITFSQKQWNPLDITIDKDDSIEDILLSSPEELSLEALLLHSHIKQLRNIDIIEEDKRILNEIYTNIPIFTPYHYTMLKSLYNIDNNLNNIDKSILDHVNDFIHNSAYLFGLKEETNSAHIVSTQYSRLNIKDNKNDNIAWNLGLSDKIPKTANEITKNLLSQRYYHLKNNLQYHTNKYYQLLTKVNNILKQLYNEIINMNENKHYSSIPKYNFYPTLSLKTFENNCNNLEISFYKSKLQQLILLWRLLYRSISLLII